MLFYIAYCIVVKSFRLGRLGPIRRVGALFRSPSSSRLDCCCSFDFFALVFCVFASVLLGSFRQGMSCGAAGPLFRGTACLDFGVKPRGARPTYVWEHVALNPRVLLFGCDFSYWWLLVAFPFAFFFLVLLRIRRGFLGRAAWRWPSGLRLRRPKHAFFFCLAVLFSRFRTFSLRRRSSCSCCSSTGGSSVEPISVV